MKKVLVITMLIILLFTFKSNLLSIEPIWEKQYDVKGIEFYQGPDALLQTSDGCYVFASICSTKPELGNKFNTIIQKIDKDGNKLWDCILNIKFGTYFKNMYEDIEGNIIILASYGTSPQYMGYFSIAKINKNGEQLGFNWSEHDYSVPAISYITPYYDKKLYFQNVYEQFSDYYYITLKVFDSTATLKETRHFDSVVAKDYWSFSMSLIKPSKDSNFLSIVHKRTIKNIQEKFLTKFDRELNKIYQHLIINNSDKNMIIDNYVEDTDSTIIIFGEYRSNSYNENDSNHTFIRKQSIDGNILWEKQYGKYRQVIIYSLIKINPNRYLGIGSFSDELLYNREGRKKYFLEIDSLGDLINEYYDLKGDTCILSSTVIDKDNNLVIFGYKNDGKSLSISKYPINIFLSINEIVKSNNNNSLIFPNPTTDYITINLEGINQSFNPSAEGIVSVEIYDMMGVKMQSIPVETQNFVSLQQRIDISNLTPGVYFVKIGDKVEKLVKY